MIKFEKIGERVHKATLTKKEKKIVKEMIRHMYDDDHFPYKRLFGYVDGYLCSSDAHIAMRIKANIEESGIASFAWSLTGDMLVLEKLSNAYPNVSRVIHGDYNLEMQLDMVACKKLFSYYKPYFHKRSKKRDARLMTIVLDNDLFFQDIKLGHCEIQSDKMDVRWGYLDTVLKLADGKIVMEAANKARNEGKYCGKMYAKFQDGDMVFMPYNNNYMEEDITSFMVDYNAKKQATKSACNV